MTLEVLRRAADSGEPPGAVALAMAEARSLEPHPVWGHRGQAIIASLVRSGWAEI